MTPLQVTVVDHATQASRSYSFEGPRVRIGREADNDLYLPYGYISRWHGVLEYDGRTLRFRDLGSANRFSVDGATLDQGASVQLARQCSLTLGDLELQVDWSPRDDRAPTSDSIRMVVQGTIDPAPPPQVAQGAQERLRSARRTYEAALRAWEREVAEVRFEAQSRGDEDAVAAIDRDFGCGPGPSSLTHAAFAHDNLVVALATELMPHERAPNDPDEERAVVARIVQVLQTFANCFLEAQQASQDQAAELDVTLCPGDNEPLAGFRETSELLGYLLDWRHEDDGRTFDLIHRFAVVIAHQRGYVCGAIRALRRIASECDPEEISRHVSVPWLLRAGACWRRYRSRYSTLLGDGNERLAQTLRNYIAEEYCDELARSGVSLARRA